MTLNPRSLENLSTAQELLDEFRIIDRIYLLGSFAYGLTVFDQQVRAHNLAWALWRCLEAEETSPTNRTVAIIGGGIAGLTTAACLLARSLTMRIFLFEERWDLCPLQQGSDTRWIHPHLYRWPEEGSRVPDAGLPVLNWTEGRASDVSRSILDGFGRYAHRFGNGRLNVLLGLSHLRIDASRYAVEWMGRRAERTGSHFRAGSPEGGDHVFDTIVLATGFGLEVGVAAGKGATSYWRNDQVGQPRLFGARATFLVSGFGDGALVDLCRLTMERFRQDTVLYELFDPNLEKFEAELRDLLHGDFGRSRVNVQDLLAHRLSPVGQRVLEVAQERLLARLRKDTHVILHASGRQGVTSIKELLGPHSSFLNRVLLFLLYRCGAFTLALGEFEAAKREFDVPDANVLTRHGTATADAIKALFSCYAPVKNGLLELERTRAQTARRLWPLGAFPYFETEEMEV